MANNSYYGNCNDVDFFFGEWIELESFKNESEYLLVGIGRSLFEEGVIGSCSWDQELHLWK